MKKHCVTINKYAFFLKKKKEVQDLIYGGRQTFLFALGKGK